MKDSQPADYALRASNRNRSAQVVQIDSSKHVVTMALCAVICGICMALSAVSAIIAWNSITENRITQSKYEALRTRVGIIEGERDAIRRK